MKCIYDKLVSTKIGEFVEINKSGQLYKGIFTFVISELKKSIPYVIQEISANLCAFTFLLQKYRNE